MKTNLGIVFSGGGVRTLAHVGLIRLLEEQGLRPTHVAGTSAGAIVAALYAAGHSHRRILEFFRRSLLFRLPHRVMGYDGFLSTNEYSDIFRLYFRQDDFDSLHMKLYVAATDILSARCRIFSSGRLIPALLASAAYPLVFKPVEIEGRLYFDGGITNDFPVEPLSWQCDCVVGCYVTPLKPMERSDFHNPMRLLQRAYDVSTMTNSLGKFALCDLVLQPEELLRFGTFDIKHADDIFEIGYLHARNKLDDLLRLIDRSEHPKSLLN